MNVKLKYALLLIAAIFILAVGFYSTGVNTQTMKSATPDTKTLAELSSQAPPDPTFTASAAAGITSDNLKKLEENKESRLTNRRAHRSESALGMTGHLK
tara:strand:+ start:566 stop:862 length:297 start_codon:yes stop_codon:yes gene_type:complete